MFAMILPAADLAATCLCWSPVLDRTVTAFATLMCSEAASRAAFESARMNRLVSDVLIINKLIVWIKMGLAVTAVQQRATRIIPISGK